MRKWKCVYVAHVDKNTFTCGKIYESDDRGYNIIGDDGCCFTELSADKYGWGFTTTKFEEVFEEKEENKMKFKVGDKVRIIANNNGHCFNIGDTVELYQYEESYQGNKSNIEFRGRTIKNESWGNWLATDEMELITQSKTLTITTSDTITTLTDGTHTTTVKRHIDDKHNERSAVGYVVDKYFDELKEIERVSKLPRVGDKVKVIDDGKAYSTYSDWLLENKVDIKYAIKWKNGNAPRNGDCYTVIKIHPHENAEEYGDVALIDGSYGTFLIGVEGLEVVK